MNDINVNFNDLVELMTSKLTYIARYYLRDDAEDAVADVWEKVWAKRHLLEECENIPAWLATVTRRHCIDIVRREGKVREKRAQLSFDDYTNILSSDDYDPERCYLVKEKAAIISRYVSSVREIYGLPLKLYYYDRLSVKSIAGLLNVSESVVKWRLYTGRQQIKNMIIKDGFNYG